MEETKFDLVQAYSDLTTKCSINKLGENINYYQSDDLSSNILVRNCIEIDMISAFPNICRYLFFTIDPNFVIQLTEITDKLKRNIFLTNYLKDKGNKEGRNYLIELNNYAKMLTLGYIYNNYDNVNILEFKKDGALFVGELIHPKNPKFNKFTKDYGFNFHLTAVKLYLRFNKTSIYKYPEKHIVKGKYKDPPKFIQDHVLDILIDQEDIYSQKLINIAKIYSLSYYKILRYSELYEDIRNNYAFAGNKYITTQNKLEQISIIHKNLDAIHPFLVLNQFIYPIISLFRLEK